MIMKILFRFSVLYALFVLQPSFSSDRFADAAPVSVSSQYFYRLSVTFKKQLTSDDQQLILRITGQMASKPITVSDREVTIKPPTFPSQSTGEAIIIIVGPSLTNSEKDSVEKFASNMVNSYVIPRGNVVTSVVMNDADSPNARRQFDDVQRLLDDELLSDISS